MMKKEEQALLIFERKIFRISDPKYENGERKCRTNRELEEMNKGENTVKWIKGQRISWLGHLERMEEERMPKNLHSKTARDKVKRKTQERKERGSRKRSSSARGEKMDSVGDRQEKMERYCTTGQSPQRAVVPMEEDINIYCMHSMCVCVCVCVCVYIYIYIYIYIYF